MKTSRCTLRSLASELGLSKTTVSDALRGRGRVDPDTAERVRLAAKRSGYAANPLAGALMAEMRRSRGDAFHGVIAAIDFKEAAVNMMHKPFHKALLEGISRSANEQGFRMELFTLGRGELSVSRLDEILCSRGIHGMVVLPSWDAPDLTRLQWDRYAGVYTDYVIKFPSLHSVCSDHYRTMTRAMIILRAHGYQRPGLCIEKHRDERLQHRHSAGYVSARDRAGDLGAVPPLFLEKLNREEFVAWFKRHSPDAVICHFTEVIQWMKECGARVPETHGYLSPNVIWRRQPCAGFDLQPAMIGARAAEVAIAMLFRNERGIPDWPVMTAIPARWTEGPTLRSGTGLPGAEEVFGEPRVLA